MDKKLKLEINQKPNGKIIIKTNNKTETIDKKDIMYIEANRSYAIICCKGSRKIIASKPLAFYERELGNHDFVRCHNSFLVNKNELESMNKTKQTLILAGSLSIPVARRKLKKIEKMYLIVKQDFKA